MLHSYMKYFIPFVIFLSACASLPPPPPSVGEKISALGVKVTVHAPLFSSKTPDTMYFVRVDNPEMSPKLGKIVASNYHDNDVFYLLNAEPGYYMAVLAYIKPAQSSNLASSYSFTIPFPEKVVLSSKTELKPGTVAFMGDIEIDTKVGSTDSDDFQKFIRSTIGQNKSVSSNISLQTLFTPFATIKVSIVWTGIPRSMNRSPETKKIFIIETKKTFKGTTWEKYFLNAKY